MTSDLGDEAVAGEATTVTLPSNTAGVAGDAVTWDSSNDRVDATDASTEDVFGVLAEDAPGTAGDPVSVHIHGPVVANAGGSVVQGDVLIPSSTEGQLAQNSDGTGTQVDVDGTTDQGVFAPANPYALTDSGGSWPLTEGNSLGTNEAVVMLR